MRTSLATLVRAALVAATPFRQAHATDFTVNDPGFAVDNNPGNGACATAGGVCTLHAAIQESNALSGSHTISFDPGIMALTALGADIPDIIAPIVINGTNSNGATGNRVEIDANNRDCFDFDETNTPAHPTGARGSTLANFVIRNCSGDGVDLSGHGYTVSGNRIGTNGAGTASDINTDANNGDGISISGTIPPPALPDISGIIANPPANFGAIVAFAASISSALTVIASPTFITGNLISGNTGDGIELFTPMTVNVQINTNIIGLNQSSTLALANGRGGGDAAGIRLTGSGYGNFIGPANIISGQTEPGDNGIVIQPGEVLLPNFIMGNLVGPGATQIIDVGNAESGIVVDTRPDTTMPGVNPTGFSLFLGPANTVSDNRGTNAADPDTVGGDTAAGIVIANSSGVRVYGNQIGAFAFPAGGTPIGSLDTGNAGDGIIVVNSPQVQIGGSEVFEGNLVLRNAKHGILVRGTGTNGTIIRNNFVGVSIDALDVFDFANGADGLHINASGRIEIGGTGDFEDNVIAGNGRHGIAMRNGGLTQGWANHMQRNQIYRNTGLAIDHNVTEEAPDPTDNTPDQDPNDTFYTNYGQNAPVLTAINGAVQYTFQSANSRQYRLDIYQDTSAGITAATAEARTWISETTITTNGTGAFTGSVAAPSGGGFVTVTATDISPSNDLPGPPPAPDPGPHNNTSELSNALQLIEYTVSDPSVVEGASATTAMLTFVVTRSSSTGTGSVDVATANGNATTGDNDYVALATTTVPFADGQASANVQVTVNGDAKFEPDETVLLDLSNPMNGTIADAQGVGTITNDDTQPAIAIDDVDLREWRHHADGDRAGHRRDDVRARRDLRHEPRERGRRRHRRSAGPRHHHERRRAADDLGRRPVGGRRQHRLEHVPARRLALEPEQPDDHRDPDRDRGLGRAARRLHRARSADRHVRARRDAADRDAERRRRHRLGRKRDADRDAERARERDDPRRQRSRHDHRRRRRHGARCADAGADAGSVARRRARAVARVDRRAARAPSRASRSTLGASADTWAPGITVGGAEAPTARCFDRSATLSGLSPRPQ